MGLNPFEGHNVIASGIEMPGASGGLNKALRVNNLELHHDDEGVLVIRYRVAKVRFDRVPDSNCLERVHVLKVLNATTIGEEVVADALDAQTRRNEEAQGVHRLPLDGDHQQDPDSPDVDVPAPEAAPV